MHTNLFNITYPENTYVFELSKLLDYDSIRALFKDNALPIYTESSRVYFWASRSSLLHDQKIKQIKTRNVKENVIRALANLAISNILLNRKLLRAHGHTFYPTIDQLPEGLEVEKNPDGIFVHDAVRLAIESDYLDLNHISLQARQVITSSGNEYDADFSRRYSPNTRNIWTLKTHCDAYNRWLNFLQPGMEYTVAELGKMVVHIAPVGGQRIQPLEQDEPKIAFNPGSDKTHYWPERGLKEFGPLDHNLGDSRPQIKIALVAAGESKKAFSLRYLEMLNEGRGYYKGFQKTYKVPLFMTQDLGTKDRMAFIDTEGLLSAPSLEDIGQIYRQAITDIKNRTNDFDVAIVEIPELLVEKFKHQHPDLRDYLKIIFLKQLVATQFLTEKTAKEVNPSSSLSNFALGLYVSAGGIPWRLEEHMPDTAYIGISFGVKKDPGKDTERLIGIASIVDMHGVSLAINAVSERYSIERGHHLNGHNICALIDNLLGKYKDVKNAHPRRVVIHKTTFYNKDEEEIVALCEKHGIEVDLLYVVQNPNIRLIPNESHAIKRGMYWQINDSSVLLYTDGALSYTGRALNNWNLNPFILRKHYGQQEITKLAREVLCLTKLNWNSTRNHEKHPVTLSHSRKVIDLLRAGLDRSAIIDDFRYYF